MASLFKDRGFTGDIRCNEPLSPRCTFRTGGRADLFLIPDSADQLILVREVCRERSLPFFLLGGGSNILVSDRGVRGVTVSLEKFDTLERRGNRIRCGAGVTVNRLVAFALEQGLGGLEFLNRLPGTVGGALFMNARCYGSEIADVLSRATYLDRCHQLGEMSLSPEEWAYKKSPFQKPGMIALEAIFELAPADRQTMETRMKKIAADRIAKGHFTAPCAGSTFKNNRAFGKPSGQIIDECGFKGHEKGGAQVAPWHGNIFINRKEASSQDISDLIDRVQSGVEEKTGFRLEPEVIRVGEWL